MLCCLLLIGFSVYLSLIFVHCWSPVDAVSKMLCHAEHIGTLSHQLYWYVLGGKQCLVSVLHKMMIQYHVMLNFGQLCFIRAVGGFRSQITNKSGVCVASDVSCHNPSIFKTSEVCHMDTCAVPQADH